MEEGTHVLCVWLWMRNDVVAIYCTDVSPPLSAMYIVPNLLLELFRIFGEGSTVMVSSKGVHSLLRFPASGTSLDGVISPPMA